MKASGCAAIHESPSPGLLPPDVHGTVPRTPEVKLCLWGFPCPRHPANPIPTREEVVCRLGPLRFREGFAEDSQELDGLANILRGQREIRKLLRGLGYLRPVVRVVCVRGGGQNRLSALRQARRPQRGSPRSQGAQEPSCRKDYQRKRQTQEKETRLRFIVASSAGSDRRSRVDRGRSHGARDRSKASSAAEGTSPSVPGSSPPSAGRSPGSAART